MKDVIGHQDTQSNHPSNYGASRLQLSPFTPIKVPQSILNMSKKQIQARNDRENASRSLITNSAAIVDG